ncbi:hypothetical protein C8Q72DRAFT_968451, partial [Fomitopsis betulina]
PTYIKYYVQFDGRCRHGSKFVSQIIGTCARTATIPSTDSRTTYRKHSPPSNSTQSAWEHRTWRWIDAYRDGLGVREAHSQVKQFGTRQYKSHRRIPETVARQLDA